MDMKNKMEKSFEQLNQEADKENKELLSYNARAGGGSEHNEEEEKRARLDKAVERLSSIARIVGGDFGMKVSIGKAGGESYYNPDDCSITLDPLHILEDEEMADFVVGHEGSHRAITRSAVKFGYPREQVKAMYDQTGFGYMHNVIEDPAVNDWMEGRHIGFHDLTRATYDKQFTQENAVLATLAVRKIAKKLGHWPKFAHFGSEVIRRWFSGRYSEKLDPDVEQALKKTEFFSDQSRQAIPSPNTRSEGLIVSSAKRRFELNNQYIWPEMKKLVEMDIQLDAAQQAFKDMLEKVKRREQKQKEVGEESDPQKKSDIEEEIENLNQELKQFDELKKSMEQAVKDLEERIRRALEQEEKSGGKNQEGEKGEEDAGEMAEKGDQGNDGEAGEAGEPGEAETGQGGQEQDADGRGESGHGEQGAGGDEDGQEGDGAGKSGGSREGKGVEGTGGFEEQLTGKGNERKSEKGDIVTPFSADEEKFLKEIYDTLPRELREAYEREARKALEDLEDALNKELEGKLSEEQPKTHRERREEREEQARTAARVTKQVELENKIRETMESVHREQMTAYECIREKSKPIADYLYRNLMRVLHPEEWGGEETELPWGEKIDMARVAQAQADFRQKLKLWTRDIDPEQRDYRFQFCVDRSGSTNGIIEEEKIGLLAVADALRRLEGHNTDKVTIKHSISSFSDDYKEHKDFKKRLTMPLAEEISVIDADGGTNTLKAARRELDRAFAEGARTGSFILIFSDGQPNSDIVASGALEKLFSETKKRREQERVHIGLIWLGDGKEEQALKAECDELVKKFGFDFGLAMNAAAGKEHHFGKELTALIKGIVEESLVL